MPSPPVYVAAAVLVLHGIVHLLGMGVYLGGFELEAFAYKTTLLAGGVDVGDLGMRPSASSGGSPPSGSRPVQRRCSSIGNTGRSSSAP